MDAPHLHPVADVKGGLGHKLGPFPVGVWLLIVAGGLAIAWYARQHGAGASSSTDTTDPNAVDSADPNAADTSGGVSAGLQGSDTPSAPPVIVITRTPGTTTTKHKRVVKHNAPASSSAPTFYTVRSGDTLVAIAASMKRQHPKQYGHLTASKLYALNAVLLNTTARRHGKHNSANGHWIYAGERLRLR